MMQPGIFAKTFVRRSLADTMDAVAESGIARIQFNMACAGLDAMPQRCDMEIAAAVRGEAFNRGLTIDAVSGTFNMAHPDPAVRNEGLRRLNELAAMCKGMGVQLVTLCSGSRNETDMWSPHRDNRSERAWNEMLRCMEGALRIADEHGITLAVEPEPANIVHHAEAALKLLGTMQSDRLKIVVDAANLVAGQAPDVWAPVLEDAVGKLGGHIVLAHAKDVLADAGAGDGGMFAAAGKGGLDYGLYVDLLNRARYSGPLIMHGLAESEVPGSLAFLRRKLDAGKK